MKNKEPNYWKALFKKSLWWLIPFAFIKKSDWIYEPDTVNETAERASVYSVNVIMTTFYCVLVVVFIAMILNWI